MYKKENKIVLLCAASRGDISKIKNVVKQIAKILEEKYTKKGDVYGET